MARQTEAGVRGKWFISTVSIDDYLLSVYARREVEGITFILLYANLLQTIDLGVSAGHG